MAHVKTSAPAPPGTQTATTFQLGTYNPATDTFTLLLDLNDQSTTWWLKPKSLKFEQKQTPVIAENVRQHGGAIVSDHWGNIVVGGVWSIRGASAQAVINAWHTAVAIIKGAPKVPFCIRFAWPQGTAYSYLDVQYAEITKPPDNPLELLAKASTGIAIAFQGGYAWRGDRLTISNLCVNPGFEAPSGPGVSVFNDPLTTLNAYAPQQYTATVLPDGPSRLYALNDPNGTVARDTGIVPQNGTYTGGFTLGQAGPSGGGDGATLFNGTTGYVSLPTTGLPTGNVNYTLECWVKIAANPAATVALLHLGNALTSGAYLLLQMSNTGTVSLTSGAATSPVTSALSTGVWHHVAGVYDGAKLHVYLDGAESGTGTAYTTLALAYGTASIADYGAGTGEFAPATLAMAAHYPFALSLARITAHYNAGAPIALTQDVAHYSDLVLADQPLRYYRMDEASGTVAFDASTNRTAGGTYNAGDTLGVAGALQGDSDTAITTNGTTGYLFLTAGGNLPAANAAFTLECWFKFAANPVSGSFTLFSFGANAGTREYVECGINTTGNLFAAVNPAGGTITGLVATTAVYHHAAVTWDGTTLRLYQDGKQVASSTPGALAITYGNAYVGTSTTAGNWYSGQLDEFACYGAALNANRIQAHYRLGKDTIAYTLQQEIGDGAMALYRLDEASGTVAYSVVGTPVVENAGTYTGTVTLGAVGPFAGATGCTFDGTTGYMDAPNAGITGCSWGTFDAGAFVGNSLSPPKTEAVTAGKFPSLASWYATFKSPFSSVDGFTSGSWAGQLLQLNECFNNNIMPMITWEPADATLPGGVLNVGLQTAYTLQNIIAGDFDTYINTWATGAAAWGHPMILRFAHEMNGTWYPWAVGVNGNTAAQFITAWQHVHALFVTAGATNVKWCWCPNVEFAGASTSLASVYPTDAYVDLLGLDGYNNGTVLGGSWQTFVQVFATAAGPGATSGSIQDITTVSATKPLIICEIGCVETGGSKAAWLADAFGTQLPQNYPQVRGLIWFDNNSGGGLDYRINSSAASATAFQQWLGVNPYYGGSYFNWGSFSAELWFNQTALVAAKQTLAGTSDPTSSNKGWQLNLAASGASLSFVVGNGTSNQTITYTFSFLATTWYHVVATYNGLTGAMTLYVNGVSQATGTLTGGGPLGNPAAHLNLARNITATNQFFKGTLAHVALTPLLLTSTQAANHYAARLTTSPPALATSLSVPAGARCSFGSPAWGPVQTWQTRFRFNATANTIFTWYLHYTDSTNNLYLQYQQQFGTFYLVELINGTSSTRTSAAVTMVSGVPYWLQITQFPSITGNLAYFQVVVLTDNGGAPGPSIATLTAFSADPSTALIGRPQLQASVSGLVTLANSVSLFGPGGWFTQPAQFGVTGQAAGAWERATANTLTSGAVTSLGAARMDLAPAGTTDTTWHIYAGGTPAGTWAMPVSAGGDTVQYSVWVRSSGLSASCTQAVVITEYDSFGNQIHQSANLSAVTGVQAAWTQLSGAYTTTSGYTAYVDIALRVQDLTGGSAGGTVWWENVLVYDSTSTGNTGIPYCELRFPQSPAQLVVSGLLGDVAAPSLFQFATYLASWTAGSTALLKYTVGRRAIASAGAALVGDEYSVASFQSNVLDATSYGGAYTLDQSTLVGGGGAFANTFNGTPAALQGTYELLVRALTANATPSKVGLSPVMLTNTAPWGSGTTLDGYEGVLQFGLTAQNAWTVVDAGKVVIPQLGRGATADLTQNFAGGGALLVDQNASAANAQVNWEALIPIDGGVLAGQVQPNFSVTTQYLWIYTDGLGGGAATAAGAAGGNPSGAAIYSLENTAVANAGHAAGGAGGPYTTFPRTIFINAASDPFLTLDPTLGGAPGAAGVNQLVGYLSDQTGAVYPLIAELQYTPLFLQPR